MTKYNTGNAGGSTKNPKNEVSPLFRGLTRLFSGPYVNFRRQQIRKGRKNQLQTGKFLSLGGLEFKKDHGLEPFKNLTAGTLQAQSRSERYLDFDQMEYMPEIASTMDLYADEITTTTDFQELLKIKCPNEEIKSILHTLFYEVLNIEFNLFGWTRTMCKYGDLYLYLDIDEKLGITNVIGLPPVEVERMEGEDKTNPNYVQYQWNAGGVTFENWQIAHFRILGNDKFAPYGTSILEPARRIWRQLVLIEDAMMAYRVVRSPERRVFYIDVGNIDPNDVEAYIEKMKTNLRRHQIVDQSTGRVDLRYNPLSIEEDYFVPLRGEKSSRIETLPGGTYTGDIDDVNYLRDKLFSALKIPKSYLAQTDQMEDKTTLAQKDVHFARTIQRLQRAAISEMYKLAVVHLYTLGYRDKDLASFTLHLNNPSRIAELQELEYMNTKFGLINNTPEGFFSKRWIAKNVLNHSDDEIVKNKIEMFHDAKFAARLEATAAEEAAMQQQAMMGGMPGMMGGMPGMMPGMPGPEELAAMAPPGGEMPAGEESMLLAEPGAEEAAAAGAPPVPGAPDAPIPKRNDGRSHGGPYKRNMANLVNPLDDPRKRNTIPGDMLAFSRGLALGDSVQPDPDEAVLLEASSKVEELFNNVEMSKFDKEKINEQISFHKKRSSKK